MPHGRGGSWIWPPTRWAIYARDRFRCVYCQGKVRGGVHPEEKQATYVMPGHPRGWRTGGRGWASDEECASIDHPFPGCRVDQCVTACWRCNSRLRNEARPVLPGRTLTPRDREIGRKLYAVIRAQRERALAGERKVSGRGGRNRQA